MKLAKKLKIVLILTLLIQLAAVPMYALAVEVEKEPEHWAVNLNYLALGDSLAAGVSPYNELGKGYADFLAADLNFSFYNKGFSYPGYTTQDVLDDLKANVVKPIYRDAEEAEEVELNAAIIAADVITISAGANDVLPHITFDPETGDAHFNLIQIRSSIQKITENYIEILKHIYELNPEVQVYVMGYYNSFPYVSESMQKNITVLLQTLNKGIMDGLKETLAVFVPTAEIIAADYELYLPNPKNIHLSEAGYELVAEQFVQYMEEWNQVPAATEPEAEEPQTEEPVSEPEAPAIQFTDVPEDHWGASYIQAAVGLGLVKGYTDGSFRPDKELTRAEATSLLVRAMGLEADQPAPFTDTSALSPAVQAELAAAYHAGIVKGSNGLFKPQDSITRAQLALMIHRAYTLMTGEVYVSAQPVEFADLAGLNEEAVNAVSMLAELQIVSGSNGKFMPHHPTTRVQAAKIFVNLFDMFD